MKKLSVTISGLEEYKRGIRHGATVLFKVFQGKALLLEGEFTGKVAAPFTKTYAIEADKGELRVEHDRGDIPGLHISASIL